MQWIKYLVLPMVAIFLASAAWLFYTKQYGAAVGMLLSGLIVGGVYFVLVHPILQQDALASRLEAKGVRAQALVVSVKGTSTYVNELPVMRIGVKYTVNGKEYASETKQPVPFEALSSVQAGRRISILVDPKRQTQFVLRF